MGPLQSVNATHERTTLLHRLITRGDRTARHRTRLHLLATACLEHATEIDPTIRHEVQQRTAALLPPRSTAEARALAAIGPVILDLLPGPDGLEDDEAEAVVRTAGFIGGDAALTIMKKFRTSTQRDVPWALQANWNNFDTQDYIREVLTHIQEIDQLTVSSTEQLESLHQLRTPRWVSYQGEFSSDVMTGALDPKRIRSLTFNGNTSLKNLEFLRGYTALTALYLIDCPNLKDLTALIGSTVNRLQLTDCDAAHIEDIEGMTGLQHLGLNVRLPYQDLGSLPPEREPNQPVPRGRYVHAALTERHHPLAAAHFFEPVRAHQELLASSSPTRPE